MTPSGKRFVVTGGAGFIGSHLVDALLREGATSVAVVDNFFLGRDENLADAITQHGDAVRIYRDDAGSERVMAGVCDKEKPDVVFNIATKALAYSFFNPAGALDVNVDLVLAQLELLRKGAYGRLVHLSSSEVYGTAQTVPMAEEHPLLAETTYAAGKAAADLAVAAYVRMFGLDVSIVRPFNNYGPRQNDCSFAAVIPVTVRRIFAGEQPTIDGDGLQTRDFVFVRDTVDAILRLLARDDVKGRVFNVGSGKETTIREIVGAVSRLLGWHGGVRFAPARPADVRRHCAAVDKVEALIGPIARTSLDTGLDTTVRWYERRARGN
ncbi:MAG TPA: GDP-mannose 4,6-dehydratase [Polyangiaceae bacterium]|nr:GDP-mannose 4,6-dehydratase [Polyangiaceae bacterium]